MQFTNAWKLQKSKRQIKIGKQKDRKKVLFGIRNCKRMRKDKEGKKTERNFCLKVETGKRMNKTKKFTKQKERKKLSFKR